MRVLPFHHVAAVAGSLLVSAVFASCSTSPYYDHRFQPAPYEAQVTIQEVANSQARALVTVLGIERKKDGLPDRAVVRIRIENMGLAPAQLVTDSVSLLTADLKSFGKPSFAPPEPKEVAKDENMTVDCAFPLPEGHGPYDLDLSGLNLRFDIAFSGTRVPTGMTFQRADWRYLEDDSPRVHVGFGVGVYNSH